MKIIRIIIWIGFIIMFLVMRYYAQVLQSNSRFGIVAFELSKPKKGKEILNSWENTQVSGRSLLRVAEVSTYYDFLFIVFYTALLFYLSRSWKYNSSQRSLTKLLQVNLPLILLAGVLDIVENCILLYNISNWQAEAPFISAWWIASLKFLLLGWVILVLLLYVSSRLVSYFRPVSEHHKSSF